MSHMDRRPWALALAVLAACSQKAEDPPIVLTELPDVAPAEAHLTRLTATQYRAAITDVLGEGLALPPQLEPDLPSSGLLSVGASESTISAWGVEQYENGAFSIAAQIMDDETRRAALVPCTPEGTVDAACTTAFVEQVGRRLWRRPLETDERDALVAVANEAAMTLDDFYAGLEFALAGLLQSPHFLFRVELGESGRYDDWEMASRLSFFLWNTVPDEALLDAAAEGALSTAEGLAAQARRMIDDERARDGVRQFFTDMYELYELDALAKDPTLFVHFSTDVGGFAREETLRLVEYIVFEKDADYRELITTNETFVNRHLASIYSVPAASREGFAKVTLPRSSGRRGVLGHLSFLGLQSHPAASSAVLRGLFVRKVLLCQEIPPPPVDVNTALPEPTEVAPTLRERNKIHLENPSCAQCHNFMDPIGLGFENFDGLGRWREKDNGALIDASGDLDGKPFTDAWEMAEVVREHENVGICLTRTLYRYATSHVEQADEGKLIVALSKRFEEQGYRIKALLFDIVTSPGFAKVEVQ